MKFEPSHDRLARQIYDKASVESKNRRKAQALVERALVRFRERGILLTQDDIDEIKPFEKLIAFSKDETTFLATSKAALAVAARRRMQIILSIAGLFALLAVFAIWQWQRSVLSGKKQIRMRLALQADDALEEGQPSLAFRLAEAASALPSDANSSTIIKRVSDEIWDAGLRYELSHPDTVLDFAFLDDSTQIITGCRDGIVRRWNIEGNLVETYHHHNQAIHSIAVAKMAGAWASASRDSTVGLWNGDSLIVLAHPAALQDIRFNPTQKLLMTACQDGTLRLYDYAGSLKMEHKERQPIISIGFNAKGDHLLYASRDKVVVQPLFAALNKLPITNFERKEAIEYAHIIESDQSQLNIFIRGADSTFIVNSDGQLDTNYYKGYGYLNQYLKKYGVIEQLHFGQIFGKNPALLMVREDSLCQSWSARRVYEDGSPIKEMDFIISSRKPFTYAAYAPSGLFCLTASKTNKLEIWKVYRKQLNETAERQQDVKLNKTIPSKAYQATFVLGDSILLTSAKNNTVKIWHWQQEQSGISQSEKTQYLQQHLRSLSKEEKEYYHIR